LATGPSTTEDPTLAVILGGHPCHRPMAPALRSSLRSESRCLPRNCDCPQLRSRAHDGGDRGDGGHGQGGRGSRSTRPRSHAATGSRRVPRAEARALRPDFDPLATPAVAPVYRLSSWPT
jgi:hypothetical protein